MFRFLIAGLFAVAYLLNSQVSQAAIIFDSFTPPGAVSSVAADKGRGTRILVGATNVIINQIGVRVDLGSGGNLKFVIFDHVSHNLLFSTGSINFGSALGLDWKSSGTIGDFTLLAGQSYDIGAIADVAGDWSRDDVSESMNGITSQLTSSNPNFDNFAAPNYVGPASQDSAVQLGYTAPPPSSVPEPAGFVLFGLGIMFFCARTRNRQHLKPAQ